MKKLIWTVLFAFVMASVPVGGTAFAGQGHGVQTQVAKNGKHHKKHKSRSSPVNTPKPANTAAKARKKK